MPSEPAPLAFRFGLALLAQEGGYLLRAFARHPEMAARLPDGFLATATGRHVHLFGPLPDSPPADPPAPAAANAASVHAGIRAGLTIAQNEALDRLEELMALARDTARRAFKGNGVKLHDDYLVGEHDSRTLGDILRRAVQIADSCTRDAAALAAKGWLATDTTALRASVKATGDPDAAQVEALSDQTDATDARNRDANAYFEDLLTIQNAANIQWPASAKGNVGVRGEFRLGSFPPRLPKKAPPAPGGNGAKPGAEGA